MRWKRVSRVKLIVVTSCAGMVGAVATCHAAPAASLPEVRLTDRNPVPACVTPQRLTAFLRSRNPRFDPRYNKIAGQYAKYGARLGVRWDIGFLQMLVETANLSFHRPDGKPGDVASEHNNFAGIGAVGDGKPGETFISIAHGVRAHLEHVLHYAGVAVPAPIAERTRKVQAWRILADWHKEFDRPIRYGDLARRWAPHSEAYLASIELLARTFQSRYCDAQPVLMVNQERRPAIAKTAWRFTKMAGRPGSAGTNPPTGRPNFLLSRGSLGVGVLSPSTIVRRPAAAVAPPPVKRQQRRREPIVAARHRPPRAAAAHGKLTTPRARQPAPSQRRKISSDDRIRQMISDRKVLLRTHVGVVIPIVYDSNGRMSGEAGALSFFLGSSRDKGRWWVEKGKLCQKWRIWLDRDTHCMRLKKRRGTIRWHADDGKSGTARIVAN